MQRLSSKFVEGKATKDQIAILKALETRLDNYISRLVDAPNPITQCEEGETPSSEKNLSEVTSSHEIVIDFVSRSRCHTANIGLSHQSSIESVALVVVDELVPSIHGPLGWAPVPLIPEDVPVEEPIILERAVMISTTVPPPRSRSVVAGIPSASAALSLDGQKDSLDRINDGLAGLKDHEKEALVNNCDEVRAIISWLTFPHFIDWPSVT